jgi:hypothetical protein
MKKYNLPLTYAPKIPKVLSGECRQTIRVGRKFKPCDLVSFHGWEGKPYRSKWSFRTPYFIISTIVDLEIHSWGLLDSQTQRELYWDMPWANEIAERDGIDPPTGEELGRVLCSMHKIPDEGLPAQIIVWASLDRT